MTHQTACGTSVFMSARRHSRSRHDAMSEVASGDRHCLLMGPTLIDPRVFGLTKATYAVAEALEQLSIGRTALYAAVKRRELNPVKFGRKTLFYATDLAAFLTRLKQAGS